MISKELLSEVLESDYGCEIYDFELIGSTIKINSIRHKQSPLNDELFLTNIPYGWHKIYNIYELSYKCKAWAYEQGYLIGLNARQGVTMIDIKTNRVLRYISIDNLEQLVRFEFSLYQWILDNKSGCSE